jgi:SAM-dependent methyltransferase
VREIAEIYQTYSAYHQSQGSEQNVVDPESGQLRERSEVLLDRLLGVRGMPLSGQVLDVGCGTGGTLKAFGRRGSWRLCGLELDKRNQETLERIDGFETLYTCAISEVPQLFSVITMVHSLEHFSDPVSALQQLRNKIMPGGRLFVQVPNAQANPFDYLVADHLIHFNPITLKILLHASGFAVDCLATDWVAKEISSVSQPVEPTVARLLPSPEAAITHVRGQIQWLLSLIDAASQAATAAHFGLFGSSIAATWLCSVLGDRVSFFVEEDRNRIGRDHMGRPILSPEQVPSDSVVFVALAPEIAAAIVARLGHRIQCLRLPPS